MSHYIKSIFFDKLPFLEVYNSVIHENKSEKIRQHYDLTLSTFYKANEIKSNSLKDINKFYDRQLELTNEWNKELTTPKKHIEDLINQDRPKLNNNDSQELNISQFLNAIEIVYLRYIEQELGSFEDIKTNLLDPLHFYSKDLYISN
jgi:hypothetical protein